MPAIAYEVPSGDRLADRLDAVLRVLYLVFNEGYDASAGEALIRRELCAEAIRLARVVATLMPDEPEALGLLALLLLTRCAAAGARAGRTASSSGSRTRTGAGGTRAGSRRGRRSWSGAAAAAGSGPYQLQAAIAAVHDEAASRGRRRTGPRSSGCTRCCADDAVARRRAQPRRRAGPGRGAGTGLAAVDALAGDPSMAEYRFFHATRADFLRRLGRWEEASDAYGRALELTTEPTEAAFLAGAQADIRGRSLAG